jgi:hypothetical protein
MSVAYLWFSASSNVNSRLQFAIPNDRDTGVYSVTGRKLAEHT